jgi:carbon-monoxide dehydrogenase medium subunit
MMRWSLPKFEYAEPLSLEDALLMLEDKPKAVLKAGGTDLLIKMKRREIEPEWVINIGRIPGLKGIHLTREKELVVGSCTTISELMAASQILPWHGLIDMGHLMGTPQIRNIATVGGNICNRSPVADVAAVLISYGADALVEYPGQAEFSKVGELFKSSSHLHGIVKQVTLPALDDRTVGAFLKHTATRGSEVSIASCAAVCTFDKNGSGCTDCKVVFGGVASSLIRAGHTEEVLNQREPTDLVLGEAAKVIRKDISPISDYRASAEYRLHMAGVLFRRSFGIILDRLERMVSGV